MAGRRNEDARREKETGFSEVKERSEVDGFAVAVAVGPWVAGERAGTEEEGRRRTAGGGGRANERVEGSVWVVYIY